jgi:hypothetical protein
MVGGDVGERDGAPVGCVGAGEGKDPVGNFVGTAVGRLVLELGADPVGSGVGAYGVGFRQMHPPFNRGIVGSYPRNGSAP